MSARRVSDERGGGLRAAAGASAAPSHPPRVIRAVSDALTVKTAGNKRRRSVNRGQPACGNK